MEAALGRHLGYPFDDAGRCQLAFDIAAEMSTKQRLAVTELSHKRIVACSSYWGIRLKQHALQRYPEGLL